MYDKKCETVTDSSFGRKRVKFAREFNETDARDHVKMSPAVLSRTKNVNTFREHVTDINVHERVLFEKARRRGEGGGRGSISHFHANDV